MNKLDAIIGTVGPGQLPFVGRQRHPELLKTNIWWILTTEREKPFSSVASPHVSQRGKHHLDVELESGMEDQSSSLVSSTQLLALWM